MHPYTTYVHGTSVLAVEGRFRWHTAGKQLNAAVQKFLVARAAAEKTKEHRGIATDDGRPAVSRPPPDE